MTKNQLEAQKVIDQINTLKHQMDNGLEEHDAKIANLATQIRIAKRAKPQDPAKIEQLQEAHRIAKENRTDFYNTMRHKISEIKDDRNAATLALGKRDDRVDAQAVDTDASLRAIGQAGKSAVDATRNELNGRSGLSPSFYRDIAAAMTGRQPGNANTDFATTQKAQARNQQNEAANRQMEAQQSQQIANRNEYTEAGKVASMQNDAQNRQNIANREGIAGSAAALMRQTNTPDVQAERSRQDQQRNIANNRRELSDAAQQGATNSMGLAAQYAHYGDEYDEAYDTARTFSMGNDGTNTNTNTNTNTSTNTNTNTNTGTENTGTDNTPADNAPAENTSATGNVPAKSAPATENTNTETPPENMTERPEGTTEQESDIPPTGAGDRQGQKDIQSLIDELLAQAKEKYPENEYDPWPDQRINFVINNVPWNDYNFHETEHDRNWYEDYIKKNYLQSDSRLKDLKGMLARHRKTVSDARMKIIRHDFDTFGKPDPEDFKWLMSELAQRDNASDYGTDYDGDDSSVLKGYAENIRNYVYNYKPEAQEINPDNDPSVTHIGPMAQDIEKVNPACISKDKNGFESVDTARVAMMNAGAIGDIARTLEDIQTRLKRLEAQNG